MKIAYIFYCVLVVTLITVYSCKKQEDTKPQQTNYTGPAMEAVSAAVYPDGGVSLTGNIHQIPENLTEYGFLLATDSLFTTNQLFVKIGTTPVLGVIKQDINTGIIKNKDYYYTMYGRTSPYGYVRYNVKSFNSSGSKSVKVDSIYPLKANIGDTLTIRGKYFSNQGINVLFGNQFSGLISSSDTLIKCIVPVGINQVSPVIILQYSQKLDTISNKFSLYAPVITSFTPTATFRDTIIINGDHFGYTNSLSSVNFAAVKAVIVSSSRKQIKVIVPDGVTTINNSITVTADLQTATSASPFQITKPVIQSVTASAYANDVITITGKYFDPIVYNNFVFFENNPTQSVTGNTTQLQVNLPEGPYPRKKATLTIKFLDAIITYPVDITIKGTWIMIANTFPFDASTTVGAFTINNTSYVLAAASIDAMSPKYLYKFDATNYSWQQLAIPMSFTYGTLTSSGNKMYLYTGTTSNNFWEYDPAANSWVQKADYLMGTRVAPTMFTIGNKIYMGLGTTASPDQGYNTPDYSFYQYDINSDSWSQVADYPASISDGSRIFSSSFVINNIAYVGGGASNHPADEFYSYTPGNNTWTRLKDFNNPTSGKFAFTSNGYGYLAGGDSYNFPNSTLKSCYKYDAVNDTWTMLPDNIGLAQLGGNGIYPGFVFVNNGNVYLGSGGGQFSQFYVAVANSL